MRFLTVAVFAALLAPPADAAGTRYLELVNTSPARLTAFEIAAAGSGTWHVIDLGGPLSGGGVSTTVGIAVDGDCRRDLRLTFADGRTLVQRGFDVCSYRTYHTGRYLRRDGAPAALVVR